MKFKVIQSKFLKGIIILFLPSHQSRPAIATQRFLSQIANSLQTRRGPSDPLWRAGRSRPGERSGHAARTPATRRALTRSRYLPILFARVDTRLPDWSA